MYYRVIPFSRSFDTYGLVYEVSKEFQSSLTAGMIVSIPFGSETLFALTMSEVSPGDILIPLTDIKTLKEVISEEIFLGELHRALIEFISRHYITLIHNALGLFFPKNVLEKIQKGTFQKLKTKDYNYTQKDITLSELQEAIFQKICLASQKKHLIYGVTGSGKTQIYMKIIERNLKEGKQTLLLIPEIILTSQIGKRVQDIFGPEVLLLHSGVSQAKKTQYWYDIRQGSAKIIVGTRSSLFYPYKNLASIIIDEQHDASYISDAAPRYNAGEVAEKLCELGDIELILGSGTPKVEIFYRALQGDFILHQLLEKYA